MTHNLKDISNLISASIGENKCELVLKNAFIINVFTGNIEKGDIAIEGGVIVGIGSYEGINEIDCTNLFASPSFIDSHVHIESSLVTPSTYADIVLKHGVTAAVCDPHEIANVLGTLGIDMMLKSSENVNMDLFYMIPSCVPASDFEENGFNIKKDDMIKYVQNERVLGLGEVMDVPKVICKDEDMLQKLNLFRNKNIDGHCPKISEKWLSAYSLCGISTDHESVTMEEAIKKVQRGLYVMIREGSAAKNLEDLISAIDENNYHRFLFCTDDRHLSDLYEKGSVDHIVRLSINKGLNPIKAITIASYNPCQCYGLKKRGAIAPGYIADIILFDDLYKLNIKNVIKGGSFIEKSINENKMPEENTMHISHINEDMLKVKCDFPNINVIKLKLNSIETEKVKRKVKLKNGFIEDVEGDNILKICVFERHKNTGHFGIGFIEGFGLKNCSIAQTICHDSHNIIAAGDNDLDISLAVNKLIDIRGGIVAVSKGKILESLELPVAGLMSNKPSKYVYNKLMTLTNYINSLGMKHDPFLTLSFMALTVIPKFKITSRGYFDFDSFNFSKLS